MINIIRYHNIMYNAQEHRFASLIGEKHTNTTSRVLCDFVKNPSPGVFHFGASSTSSSASASHSSSSRNETRQQMMRKMRKMRRMRNQSRSTPSTACNICMETVSGKVTLKCGHEMCPGCYAMHSRVNNTCPYCRDVFAPEIKKPEALRMPFQTAQTIIEDTIRDYYYEDVKDELNVILKESGNLSQENIENVQLAVYCHLYQVSMDTYHVIDEWLDDSEE